MGRFIAALRGQPYIAAIAPIEGTNPVCVRIRVCDGPFFWMFKFGFVIEFPPAKAGGYPAPMLVEGYHAYAHPIISLLSCRSITPSFPVVCDRENYSFHYAGAYSAAFIILAPLLLVAGWSAGASGAGFDLSALAPFFCACALGMFAGIAGRRHQNIIESMLKKDIESAIKAAVGRKPKER